MNDETRKNLIDNITDIQGNLKNSKYPNEQSISQGIVLRLLSALGWPVYDTQIVIPEYSIPGGRVDFALCNPKNQPVIFIEVKQPGNMLGADRQLFEYAFHAGIPSAIVTNGKEWHFYLPAEVGSYNDRRVYKLDLIERDVQESAYRLERYIGYKNVADGTALENAREDYKNVSKERQAKANIPIAWDKLLDEKDDTLLEVISKKVESLCGFKPTQNQVFEYLSSLQQEIATIPIDQSMQATYPKQPECPSVKRTRKPSVRKKIEVIFPDNTVICHSMVVNTMVEVIQKIGIERVRSLDIQMSGFPLLSPQKHKQNTYQWAEIKSGLYICTTTSTDTKLGQLNEINDTLSLGLKIQKV
jgi:hypothetical protein